MPKPMYVWSGSAWVSVASEVESLAGFATQSYASAQPGMKMVVPTSVAVGSGTGAVDTNGAVTFSGASSISLNGCFTSAYDNYLWVVNVSTNSADTQVRLRVRASGTDLTGSVYNWAYSRYRSSGTNIGTGAAAETGIQLGELESTFNGRAAYKIDFISPNLLDKTKTLFQGVDSDAANNYASAAGGGVVNNDLAYDSATIFLNTGTFGGTIRVYGMKN